jgi:hypothetical protein
MVLRVKGGCVENCGVRKNIRRTKKFMICKKKWKGNNMKWEDTLAIYEKIVAKAGFERKGKTVPYTSANGHMFSLMNKDGEEGFRFSKEVQEKYIKEWNTTTLKSHGATMRGYVLIPEKMLKEIDTMAKYLKESHEYVMSLDPK